MDAVLDHLGVRGPFTFYLPPLYSNPVVRIYPPGFLSHPSAGKVPGQPLVAITFQSLTELLSRYIPTFDSKTGKNAPDSRLELVVLSRAGLPGPHTIAGQHQWSIYRRPDRGGDMIPPFFMPVMALIGARHARQLPSTETDLDWEKLHLTRGAWPSLHWTCADNYPQPTTHLSYLSGPPPTHLT